MSTYKLGAPRIIAEGIRDASGRVVVNETIVEPTHVPIIFLLTEKQHDDPLYMYPSQISQYLGEATLDRGSKYFSHQSQILEIVGKNANPFLFYPVKVDGAKKAFVRLSVAVTDLRPMASFDVAEEEVAVKQYHLAWMNGTDAYPEDMQEFGSAEPFSIAENTMVYPILEMEVEYAGDYGNKFGLQIKQITADKAAQGVTKTTAQAYTLSVIERLPSGKAQLVRTVFGEETIVFTLDPEVTDRLGRHLHLPLAFQNAFNLNSGSVVQNFGEFEEIKIYENNLETVQEMLYETEKEYDHLIPELLRTKWALGEDTYKATLLNIFTGKMFDGTTSYSTFTVDKSLLIGDGNVAYAKNGASGIPEHKSLKARFNQANALLDSYVFDLQAEVQSPHSNLNNNDRWDFSVAYDSGFAPEAKNTLIDILGARKDVTLFLTPMSYGSIEVLPEIEVVSHEGYMRGVNNFQPIPYRRTGDIEVKGLITNMLADRDLQDVKLFVDDVETTMTEFVIDSKGYWTARAPASAFGKRGYQGLVHFTARIGVKNEPTFPIQNIKSTAMEYTVIPATLPVPVVRSIWGSQPVPYTKNAGEFQGALGAIIGDVTAADGTVNDLFDVLSAKFVLGNGKELDISRNFTIWDTVYGTPKRADFLKGYDKKGTAKLVMRVRDRLSLETAIVESTPVNYDIAFPVLKPVVNIKEINGGQPVIPNYTDVNVPSVIITGEVTGLGVDALLVMDRFIVKVAGVNVSNAVVKYDLASDQQSATFTATVQRGYFPVLLSQDQNINISPPEPGIVGESYHAKADVEIDVNYKQKYLDDAILPVAAFKEVYVSDVVGLSMNWDGIVDYNDPIPDLVDPNDGIILVSNIPVTAGIENVGVTLNGSYYDYKDIVSAKATIAGQPGYFDLKVLSNMTSGAGRIIAEKFWPNFSKSGNVAFELIVKHRAGTNVKLTTSQNYTVKYPVLPALTTTVETINVNNTVWFDEAYGNPDKTVPVTGKVAGLHTLRRQKTVQMVVDNIVREDIAVTINKAAGTWSAAVPVKYLNLDAGGKIQLNMVMIYSPDNVEVVATATAKNYTINKVVVPAIAIDSVNLGQPVQYTNGIVQGHSTEIIVGAYNGSNPVTIAAEVFGITKSGLTINGVALLPAQMTWTTRTVGAVTKLVATVPTSVLIIASQPFASVGTASAKVSLYTLHNSRPYEVAAAKVNYAIAPKFGEIAVSVDSYNAGNAIDPLNAPASTYVLSGSVTGLAPYQAVDLIDFDFQGNAIAPATFALGVSTIDEGGFITYPFTATFLGASHLAGINLPDVSAYTEKLVNDQSANDPTGSQGAHTPQPIPPMPTVVDYIGTINASALISNTVTNTPTIVDSYNEVSYVVKTKRVTSLKLNAITATLLDPGTDVIANQVRKIITVNTAAIRNRYDTFISMDVQVGTKKIPVSDIAMVYDNRDTTLFDGNYENRATSFTIPNKHIVENGEYLEITNPAFNNGETSVGIYRAPLLITRSYRDENNVTRTYQVKGTLFSRAVFGVKAVAEVMSINDGQVINRWADGNTKIPLVVRVTELYRRAMDQKITESIFTVDGKVLNGVTITEQTSTTASYYNSTTIETIKAEVKLTDLIELMTVWSNSGRVEPFTGTFGFTPKITDTYGKVVPLTRATKAFTAVEILPPSDSTMDIESVNGGATVILNSLDQRPVKVQAIVHRLHAVWGERVEPTAVTFGLNGAIVPKGDYTVEVVAGTLAVTGEFDATVTISASRAVYRRYFADEYLDIDEQALEAGVPVEGKVRVNTPVASEYGLRATLTQDKTFLAGMAVEGPEDDVAMGSASPTLDIITGNDGYLVKDLTTNEVLAEGATVKAVVTDAKAKGKVDISVIKTKFPT